MIWEKHEAVFVKKKGSERERRQVMTEREPGKYMCRIQKALSGADVQLRRWERLCVFTKLISQQLWFEYLRHAFTLCYFLCPSVEKRCTKNWSRSRINIALMDKTQRQKIIQQMAWKTNCASWCLQWEQPWRRHAFKHTTHHFHL